MCMCFVFLPTLMKMHLSRPDLSVMTSTLNKSIKNYINSVKISSRSHKVWLLTRQAIIISMLISRNAVRRDKKWNHLNLKVCLFLPRSPSVSWFSHLSLSPPPFISLLHNGLHYSHQCRFNHSVAPSASHSIRYGTSMCTPSSVGCSQWNKAGRA